MRRLYEDPDVFLAQVEVDVERIKGEATEQGDRVARLEQRLAGLEKEETRMLEWARKELHRRHADAPADKCGPILGPAAHQP